jgi:hypothetical protein
MGSGVYSGFGSNGDFDPPDPDRILETVGPALTRATLATIATTPRGARAGAILGSPDFMRC